MSSKKEETVEQARAKLLSKINESSKSLSKSKEEYAAFNKENPLSIKKNPTPHELRVQREKLGSSTSAEHAKVNAAMARKLEMNKLVKKD